jgi:hypothetical protein
MVTHNTSEIPASKNACSLTYRLANTTAEQFTQNVSPVNTTYRAQMTNFTTAAIDGRSLYRFQISY